MADVTRTFLAIDIPGALEPRLRRLQQELAPDIPAARWVDRAGFHLTLAFLGDVPHADLAAVCRAVAATAGSVGPFEIGLSGVGVFPNPKRPRVIWAGVAGPGLATLGTLQASLTTALALLGFPPETLPFHPHVTLARVEPPRGRGRGHQRPPAAPTDLTPVLTRRRGWSAGPFRVAEVITYSSTLSRDGSIYAPLARAPLKGKPAPDANPAAGS